MIYEWEQEIRDKVDFNKIHAVLPNGNRIEVLGIAIAEEGLGEACFIANPEHTTESPFYMADVWSDVKNDAIHIYENERGRK